jgi:uncharacterized protein (TIGR02118 family)
LSTIPTKITVIYDNPQDPEALEARYDDQLALGRQIPGVQRIEASKVWPKEDGTPTPAYRMVDLYFSDYAAASEAVTTAEAGAFMSDVFERATGGLRIVFAEVIQSEALHTDEARAPALIRTHFDRTNVSVAGGGPEDDIPRAHEMYAEDAVVEWPQGGERVRGKENIIGFRSAYPARQEFEVRRITGRDSLWVNEYTIRYDGRPVMCVGIMEFRDGKVVRERIYFGDPWEPPAWRAQWVELFDRWTTEGSDSQPSAQAAGR